MARRPSTKPTLTPQQANGYLAAAVDLCGSFQCRTAPGRSARKYRLAFVSNDEPWLARVREIIDAGGRIYTTKGESCSRLEYYRRATIEDVIARVRPMLGPRRLGQIEEFEALAALRYTEGSVP